MEKNIKYLFISLIIIPQLSCQVKLANNLKSTPTSSPSNTNIVIQNETLGQLEFRRILNGEKSNIRNYETRVIDSQSDFIKLWDDHTGSKTNPLFIPKIDFEAKSVIAVFLGERPTTGFSIDIANIEETKDLIKVSLKENKPPSGSEVKAEVTQPFLIIETKKSNKRFLIEKPYSTNLNNQELAFTDLETGYDSGIKDFSKRVAKTEKEFAELYREHLSSQRNINATVFPKIDFRNDMVAAVFLGERPSSGYSINVKKVIRTDSQIVIEASEVPPSPNSQLNPVITTPYQFITFPKTDLPIKFDINIIVNNFESTSGIVNSSSPTNLNVKTFLNGDNSNIKTAQFLVIQSKDDFKNIWTQHNGSNSSVLPEVDFGNNSLIAIFAGTKQTSGYNITVSSVVEINNELRVFIDISKDQAQARNIFTNPFSMFLIPKSFRTPSFIINNIT
ncbi:MAG: protease complex subunit PrcB family protein [Candidatus Sericytochromatia bacterium]